MKKLLVAVLAAAVCFCLGFGAVRLYKAYRIADIVSDERDDDGRFMTGAYTGYREMTAEEEKLFGDVCDSKDNLKPRSVATQVVAGINYRFVCTDEEGEDHIVTIYKPLPNHGDARVTGIEPCL